MKWKREENRYGDTTWTSGSYVITRRHYTLPTRSTAYTVDRDGKRIATYVDRLADAKEIAADDANGGA